jgi:hypothetical protein
MLALLAGSCIPSLFPLYTEEDLVIDDRLEGTWDGGENGIWIIKRLEYTPDKGFFSPDWSLPGDKKSYRLNVFEVSDGDTLEAEFILHILVLNGQHYLNYYPVDYELDHDFLAWHMIEANNFSKELIDKNRIKISHIRYDNGILLTAHTRELQKFVIKYGNESEAVLEPDVLKRI